jgi:alcohol dehydrogenase
MRIQAAVLRQAGLPPPYTESKPLEVIEFDLAPPGRGEVLVKMADAGSAIRTSR